MASRAVRPWFHRLMGALPGPPLAAALATTAAFAALGAAIFAVDGWLGTSAGSPHDVGEGMGGAAVLALILWAGWFVVDGFAADVAALRPVVRLDGPGFERLQRELTRFPRLGLALASLVGAGVPISYVAFGILEADENAGFRGACVFGALLFDWIVLGPMLYVAALATARLWRLGRSHVRVDVLDPGALAPFSRFGLRLLLLLNLGGGLLVANAVVETPEYTAVWLEVFAPAALLGLAALVVPCWSLHRRMRDARDAELARVRRALRGDRAALRESPLAPEADRLSIVELSAWLDRIETLRDWPFDASSLRRFGLYLLIPLASWVAAALVERLVDRLF